VEEIMNTYKVRMCWDFIVLGNAEAEAEARVADLTESFFKETSRMPEFAMEQFETSIVDGLGAGVDARL
jgi:hypothetical protein